MGKAKSAAELVAHLEAGGMVRYKATVSEYDIYYFYELLLSPEILADVIQHFHKYELIPLDIEKFN